MNKRHRTLAEDYRLLFVNLCGLFITLFVSFSLSGCGGRPESSVGRLANKTGNVSGKITDAAGLPVAGALVVIGSSSWSAVTSATGGFFISDVTAGNQPLKVFKAGYILQQTTIAVAGGATSPIPDNDLKITTDNNTADNPVISNKPNDKEMIPGVTNILLTVKATDTDLKSVTANNPNFKETVVFYDDSTHGDITSGDGVYSAQFNAPEGTSPGNYAWALYAFDNAGNLSSATYSVLIKNLSSILLSPSASTISQNNSVQIVPSCTYSDGSTDTCSLVTLLWSSSDTTLATVSSAGLVTNAAQQANLPSTVTITASAVGKSKSVTVNLAKIACSSNLIISCINCNNNKVTVGTGNKQIFSAACTAEGQTNYNAISIAAWNSSVVNKGNFTSTAGEFQAVSSATGTTNVTATSGSVTSNSIEVTVVDDDIPTAGAGSDKQCKKDIACSFDASSSADNIGIISYSWDFNAADGIITNSADKKPSYTYTATGTYTVTLTVSDAAGNKATDTLTAAVNVNLPPISNAGIDQTVNVNSQVMLDGSGSYDPDADTITYSWSQASGTSVTFSSTTAQKPTFTPTKAGTYIFNLIVNDSKTNSVSDSVNIVVLAHTLAPEVPTGFTATPGNTTASLSWTAPTKNSDGTNLTDLAGYNIYKGTSNTAVNTKVNSSLINSTNYQITGLTNGTKYYFVVTAVDTSNNESSQSSQASCTPLADTSPGEFTVSDFPTTGTWQYTMSVFYGTDDDTWYGLSFNTANWSINSSQISVENFVLMSFPLTTNKTWSTPMGGTVLSNYLIKGTGGNYGTGDIFTATVIGWENVTVDAGTFNAIKINYYRSEKIFTETSTSSIDAWFAEGVGLVKSYSHFRTSGPYTSDTKSTTVKLKSYTK